MTPSATHPQDEPGSGDPGERPSWLTRLRVDLRPGECGLCWLLFTLHYLLLTFQYASKSLRQSIFVDSLGAERLPFVYLLVALCSYPLLKVYGRLVDRLAPARLMAASCLGVAASLVAFWGWFEVAPRSASVGFYLWIAIAGILLVSQFWSYASQRLDARQARRLFGFVGAGGILGSVAGGQIASLSSRLLDTYGALLVAAGVLVGVALLMRLSGWEPVLGETADADDADGDASERGPRIAVDEPGDRHTDSLSDARDGLSVVRGSVYLKLIAAIMLLSAMVAQVIDLQFSWVIERSTETLDQRTAVFGNLYSVMGLLAFAFQMLFTARIHRRLGVGFALRVLPAANGAGTVLFLAAAAFAPALIVPAAWLLKIGENGLRYSLDQATRELLFLPVPARRRAKAKAFIDVFVQRAGKGLAAVALLAVTFGWITVEASGFLTLAWVLLWLSLLGAARRHYVASFRRRLLSRELEPEALELGDASTLEVLVEGLGSADPREVMNSLELLASHGRGRLVPPLMLHHPDPEVRCKTLEILRDEGRSDATPLVEALLADPDPEVRAAAIRALAVLGRGDVQPLMERRLADPDPRIRAAAVSYLAGLDDEASRTAADGALAEMLADGAAEVRLEAARALGGIDEPRHQAALVQLLYDADPRVVRGAIDAVSRRLERGRSNPLYTPILVSHLHHRKLKHEARDALVAYGEGVVPALQHFMNAPQEEIWVRRALPKTIARIGGPAALRALLESLGAPDPFLRRKVIEALLYLRTHDGWTKAPPATLEAQVATECRGHLRAFLDLRSLRGGGLEAGVNGVNGVNGHGHGNNGNGNGGHLLERLLAERMEDHRSNLFRLLSLLHPPRDILAAHRSLASDQPGVRAHALEYLDNLLAGDLRRAVFAVIDDLPPRERRRLARKLFELEPTGADATLRRLATLRPPGDVDAAWIRAAALHYIHEHRLSHLYPTLRRAAEEDPDPLVRETTELLLSRLSGDSTAPPVG